MIKRLKDYAAFVLAAGVWLSALPLVLGTHSTKAVDGASAIIYARLLGAIIFGAIWKSRKGP